MPPVNDDIANATVLNPDGNEHTVAFDNTGATYQTDEQITIIDGAQPSIWASLDLSAFTGPVLFSFQAAQTSGAILPYGDVYKIFDPGWNPAAPFWPFVGPVYASQWIGDGTANPPEQGLVLDPANTENGIFYIWLGDWNYTEFGGWSLTYSVAELAPTPSQGRFFDGYPWRFIVTNLNSATQTLLDRLATNRRVTPRLGAAWSAEMDVPSDSPEVNILRSGGSIYPFVQEGISLIYGFRREDPVFTAPHPWVCRFGGVLLKTTDDANDDDSITHLQAFDPWMYLYSRPVRDPDTGELPGPNGLNYDGPADQIAMSILDTTITYDGDAFFDNTTGQVDPCDTLPSFPIQRGTSVGEALDNLMATNTCEIMFTPLYDPATFPGVVAVFNIAPQIGTDQPGAIMAWDKPSRSLVGLNRQLDGTRRTNVIQYYAGQGGPPVAQFDDATSEALFGPYFEQMFIVGSDEDATESDALRELALRSYGERTYQASPATDRSPVALLDYSPGDSVPVYASANFRQELAEVLRVMEIPIEIDDNSQENVRGMTLAPTPTTES